MTARDYALLGLVIALALGFAWITWQYHGTMRDVRNERARRKNAELDTQHDNATRRETQRTDEEALEQWKKNFSDS